MKFKFKYKISAADMWQLYMYYAYSSYLAIVNVICIVSSFILLCALWQTAPGWLKFMLICFVLLFTVFQPLGIWKRAKDAVKHYPDEISLDFNDSSLVVETGGKREQKTLSQIKGLAVKPTLVVLYTDDAHGYVISNRVMGNDRKNFISYIREYTAKK